MQAGRSPGIDECSTSIIDADVALINNMEDAQSIACYHKDDNRSYNSFLFHIIIVWWVDVDINHGFSDFSVRLFADEVFVLLERGWLPLAYWGFAFSPVQNRQ